MIREAIDNKLLDRPDYSGSGKLWASDLGYCPRRAIMRILGYEGEPFEAKALEYMNFGVIYENDTIESLKHQYPGRIVKDQLRLEDEFWSGKADAVLEFDDGRVVIMEHKATGDKWWNYRDSLPKPEHVAQLCLYGYLYEKKYQVRPDLVLYYRAWGNWAELLIEPVDNLIRVTGEMNGQDFEKILDLDIESLRNELEYAFNLRDEMLPIRLKDKSQGCEFRGKPSCPMYKHCWG